MQVEASTGTVVEFRTNCLAENGHIIPNIGQLSINRSVQFWGIPDFVRGSGLSFIEKLQAPTDTTGWIRSDTSNKNWGVRPGVPYRNVSVSWGTTVPDNLSYMPMSPVNQRAAANCVRDDFLCCRCSERMMITATTYNPIVNPRLHSCGDNWEGPVTQ